MHPYWPEDFQPGSLTHYAVLAVLAGVCVLIVRGGRSAQRRGPAEVRRFERWFGIALIAIWITINLRDLMPGQLCWGRSLPLHVCDVVAFFAPLAILTRGRTARAMVYFQGIGLSGQTFFTPALIDGPATAMFWQFWVYHAGIVAAAVYLLLVDGYRPRLRDWRRAALVTAVYMLIVIPIDIRLGVNYGFLGRTPAHQPAVITAMGEWPDRLPKILLGVLALLASMQLPWSVAMCLQPVPAAASISDQFSPQPLA